MERKSNIFNKRQHRNPRKFNQFNKSNSKPKPKEPEFNLEQDFPSINKDVSNMTEIDSSKNKLNFKKLNFDDLADEKKIDKEILNGWLILTKENLIKLNKKEKDTKEYEFKKQFDFKLNKMIENWEKFRKDDINLLGDRSIYLDNNSEINKLIQEEDKILKEIDEYNEDKKYDRINNEEQTIEEFDYLL